MEYLTLEQAASILRLSPDTVARLVAMGDLEADADGNDFRILRSTIAEYVGRPFSFRTSTRPRGRRCGEDGNRQERTA